MLRSTRRLEARRASLVARLEETGSNLSIAAPGLPEVRVGRHPEAARVQIHTHRALRSLLAGDPLRLGEAYMRREIDVEGDLRDLISVVDVLDMRSPKWYQLLLALQLALRNRTEYDRQSNAVHYDLPPDFYLPWLDERRSYSHGFYESPEDSLDDAQERKLRYAIESTGLEPGMDVLDMGCGWGSFLEYAGLRGIRVHGITVSARQHAYVAQLIEARRLPCTVTMVNLLDYTPTLSFDAAVFLGTMEHVPEYDRVARFLTSYLKPGGRVYADFCSQRTSFTVGRFLKKTIWPGSITYIDVGRLVGAMIRVGFNVHALRDDTLNYAYTIRDWGDRFEQHRDQLAELTDEATVRAYLLFLRGSFQYLRTNQTQAYRLVLGRESLEVGAGV
jgi:cyclopropane-fatty-acyl-phospholipid synthase